MVKRITFTIDEKGNVTMDVSGASGPACKDLTRDYEEALGEVTSQELKDEYYQEAEQTQTNKQEE